MTKNPKVAAAVSAGLARSSPSIVNVIIRYIVITKFKMLYELIHGQKLNPNLQSNGREKGAGSRMVDSGKTLKTVEFKLYNCFADNYI